MTELETKILQRIRHIGCGESFVGLHSIEGFSGDLMFGDREKNIWTWFWCSQEAVEALAHLLETGLVEVKPTSPLVYAIEGMLPQVPIAKQPRVYKSPRWLPVVLNPVLT